jgi:5-methylcytosine-specific restriction endonuclease McrA
MAWQRLSEGRVTLCALGRVHKFITPKVLEEICGKSKTEVEWIAARYDAKGVSPDRTRPVMVPKPAKPVQAVRTGDDSRGAGGALAPGESDERLRGEVGLGDSPEMPGLRGEVGASAQETPPSLRGEVISRQSERLEFEQKWKIEAVVSTQVKAKLDRCKLLLSRKYPRGVDYDTLLGELAEEFLEHLDPERKDERGTRKNPNEKRPGKTTSATSATSRATSEASPSRHIPAGVRAQVWTRDKGRCAYVGPDGKRCNSTFYLEIDHFPIPFARGGPNNAGNLRLLCARHNRCTAEQVFGSLCRGKHAAQAAVVEHTAPRGSP